MANNNGWIKLENNIDEYGIMDKNEPFDKTHAYIDMKILCNYEDHPFSPRGGQTVIIIHRGQFHTSIEGIANRWNWSKKRTVGFLKKLERVGLIKTEPHTYGTTITLLKYDDFGIEGKTKGTTKGATMGTTEGTTKGSTKGTRYKKDKTDKNTQNTRDKESATRSGGFVWGVPEE